MSWPAPVSPQTLTDASPGTPGAHAGYHTAERAAINAIINAVTAYAVTLLAAGDAAGARSVLQLGSAALASTGDFDAAGTATTEIAAAVALLIPLAQKAAANGVASLGPDGLVPSSQIPAIAISEYLGDAASQAAMLALVGQRGDWCTRSDTTTTWVVTAEPSSLLANWKQLATPTGNVASVNGQSGTVVLGYADVGAQPTSATLTLLAALTTTLYGRGFLTLADTAAAFTKLGLGTAATHDVPASGNASAGQVVLGNDTRLVSPVVQHSETVLVVAGGDPETNLFSYTVPANPTPGDTYSVILDGRIKNHDGFNYFSRDRVYFGATVVYDSGAFGKTGNSDEYPIAFRIRLKVLTVNTQSLFVEHLLYDEALDSISWAMARSVDTTQDMTAPVALRASVLWNGSTTPSGSQWTLPGYEVRKIA